MAKAAINMMTRTCAEDFRQDGIWMNAVDPGWITNERPLPLQVAAGVGGSRLAIDEIDGAARICDPIFIALNDGRFLSGQLLKNYSVYPW
jgi:NAD(P)-dependent dehydrogenase (short-subunit alcohol dehydrogenase family)